MLLFVLSANGASIDSLYQLYKVNTDSISKQDQERELCYELSFSDVSNAKTLASKYHLEKQLANAYLDRGDEFLDKGFLIFANQFYQLGLEYFLELKDTLGLADAKRSLGLWHYANGDLKESKALFEVAFDKFKSKDSQDGLALTLLSMANVEKELGQLDQAQECLKQALKIRIALSDYHEIVRCLNELGSLFMLKKDWDKSLEFYEQSLKIIDELKDESFLANTYNSMAKVYFNQKDFDKCIATAEKSIALGKDKKTKEDDRDAYRLISDSYFELEFYENAYRNYVVYERLEKELQQLNSSAGLVALKSQLETESKDRQYIMEEEIKRIEDSYSKTDQSLYYALFILLVVVVGLMFYLFSMKGKDIESKRLLTEVQSEIDRIILEQQDDHYKMENKLLSINSLNAHIKNETLQKIGDRIKALLDATGTVRKGDLKKVLTYVEEQIDETNDWDRFRANFEKLHEGFFDRIERKCPDLTPGDMKLCAFIRVQLETKEIAALLGITSDSVVKKRNRLRKRLEVDSETDLQDFMMQI